MLYGENTVWAFEGASELKRSFCSLTHVRSERIYNTPPFSDHARMHPLLNRRATVGTTLHPLRADATRALVAARHGEVRLRMSHAHDARRLAPTVITKERRETCSISEKLAGTRNSRSPGVTATESYTLLTGPSGCRLRALHKTDSVGPGGIENVCFKGKETHGA